MIEHRTGNALAVPERPVIVAHVCNDIGRFGAGFAAAMCRTWPAAYQHFTAWATGRRPDAPPYQLGEVLLDPLFDGLTVAHMVAQHGVRSAGNPRPIRYDHLETCLRTVGDVARGDTMAGVTVAMPRIGSGLAGGSWDRIEPIVAQTLAGVPTVVYTLR